MITGGAGFLGRHLCARMLGAGVEVVCVDDLSTADDAQPRGLRELAGRPGFHVVEADVSRGIPVGVDIDAVFHLASPASPADYTAMPLHTLRTGSAGTEHALELAAARGARFVLASTSEVYGDPLQHPQPESYRGNVDPTGPRSMYDEAKRYAEALTVAYRRGHGVPTAIARIFNTYGPGMRAGDGRMIPTFVRQALHGAPVTVAGDGMQTRSLCYVDDTVRGLDLLARSDVAGPVNIGGPEELTVRAVAERVVAATGGRSAIHTVGASPDDPRRRRPEITLARSALGWSPEVSLDEGIERTVRWFAGRTDVPAAAASNPDSRQRAVETDIPAEVER
ncbi:dTDP-glucose 4,6-dehydratase [Prauserella aidingensis]|nr:dTDP-glucose 4,6-dehydratase [Prauserella aidingensis]